MDRIVTGMRDVNKEHYYEAHVTVEPIEDEELLAKVLAWAKPLQFRQATLLMQKRRTISA